MIDIYNESLGEVTNAGNININCGSSNATTDYDGQGGDAGTFGMKGSGANVRHSGNLTAAGGNATGLHTNGGYGGEASFDSYQGDNNEEMGNVEVSVNINLSGGNADATGDGEGGDGGSIVRNTEYDSSCF